MGTRDFLLAVRIDFLDFADSNLGAENASSACTQTKCLTIYLRQLSK